MAAELERFIRNQLRDLPTNDSDRPLLESMLRTTQAYLRKPTPVSKTREEFKPRPNSRLDLWLQATGGELGHFSENARVSLFLAEEEAMSLNHNHIGTEHILLGVIKEDGNANKVLSNLGVAVDNVRSAVTLIVVRGDTEVHDFPSFTPRSRRVIQLAVDEARRLNSANVDSQELLLGLVREGDGIAARVLESLGVNLERTRLEIRKMFPTTS